MRRIDPMSWAKSVAGALSVEGERLPFERALRLHRLELDKLRERGVTWRSLAALLARTGVRKENGKPYTGDHLRVAYARIEDRKNASVVVSAPATRAGSRSATAQRSDLERIPEHRPIVAADGSPKDASDDEISTALSRLRKIK